MRSDPDAPDRPPAALAAAQAAWLAPLRARLLRRALVATRSRVLDLGAGAGATTLELARRAAGLVVALDRHPGSGPPGSGPPGSGPPAVGAEASALPFPDRTFDLVFTQFALLWMPLAPTLAEVVRVLAPRGALVALEPDFGGLLEHPTATAVRSIWLAALSRAGADPRVGRVLPAACAAAGLWAEVFLLPEAPSPSPLRFDLLAGLPLLPGEVASLAAAREAARRAPPGAVAHLPVFGVIARRP